MSEIRPFAFRAPRDPGHDWERATIDGDLFTVLARVLPRRREGASDALPVVALRALAGVACPDLLGVWQSPAGLELAASGRPSGDPRLCSRIADVLVAWAGLGGARADSALRRAAADLDWHGLTETTSGRHLVELAGFETALRNAAEIRRGLRGAGLSARFGWMDAPAPHPGRDGLFVAHAMVAFRFASPDGQVSMGIQVSLRAWGALGGRPLSRSFDVIRDGGAGSFTLKVSRHSAGGLVWEPEGRIPIQHAALDAAFASLGIRARVVALDRAPDRSPDAFMGARLAAGSGDRQVPSGVTSEDRRRIFARLAAALEPAGWAPLPRLSRSRRRAPAAFARSAWSWPGSDRDTGTEARRVAVTTALARTEQDRLVLRISALDGRLDPYLKAVSRLFGTPDRVRMEDGREMLGFGPLGVEISELAAPGIRDGAGGASREAAARFEETLAGRSRSGRDLAVLELPEALRGVEDDPYAPLRQAAAAAGFLPQVVLRDSVRDPVPDSVALSAVRDLLRASGVSPVASIAPFGAVLALTCWHAGRERIWVAARMEAGAIEGALLARTPRWRPMAELTREVFTLGRLDGLLDAAAALDWLGREAGAVADPLVLLDGEALPGAGTPHGAGFERALLARATASAAILRLRAGAGAVPMTVPCPDRPAQREVAGTFLWEDPRGAWLRRASPKRMQPKKRDLAHSRDEGRVGQVAAPVSVESWILQPGRFAGAEPRLHAHVRRLCDAHVQDNEETALPCPLQELVRGLKSALPDLAARKRPRRKASLLPSE